MPYGTWSMIFFHSLLVTLLCLTLCTVSLVANLACTVCVLLALTGAPMHTLYALHYCINDMEPQITAFFHRPSSNPPGQNLGYSAPLG